MVSRETTLTLSTEKLLLSPLTPHTWFSRYDVKRSDLSCFQIIKLFVIYLYLEHKYIGRERTPQPIWKGYSSRWHKRDAIIVSLPDFLSLELFLCAIVCLVAYNLFIGLCMSFIFSHPVKKVSLSSSFCTQLPSLFHFLLFPSI